jgi:predicted transcriptional regulator
MDDLLIPKWMLVLSMLRNNAMANGGKEFKSILKLSNAVNYASYSNMHSIIKILEQKKIITIQKKNKRNKIPVLTNKGILMAEAVNQILEEVKL